MGDEVEGEAEGEDGWVGAADGVADEPVAGQREDAGVEGQVDDFQNGAGDAASHVMDEDEGRLHDEEEREEGDDDGEVRALVLVERGEIEAVGEEETEVVQEAPRAHEADGEDAEVQDEQVTVEAEEVRGAGAEQDGGAEAADDPKDGDEHGLGFEGEDAGGEGDEDHQAEDQGL